MSYFQPFQVIGFHSCDKQTALRILNGQDKIRPSTNSWDWLGNGAYFWEQNPLRALEYAEENAAGLQFNKNPIKTPFVIGAVIELGHCLNLVESTSLAVLKQAYKLLKKTHELSGQPMKMNIGARRELDCAVIKHLHASRQDFRKEPFDTIRSAFHEDDLLYAQANFSARLHIELCVLNQSMVKGYFLPQPIAEYNPYIDRPFTKA